MPPTATAEFDTDATQATGPYAGPLVALSIGLRKAAPRRARRSSPKREHSLEIVRTPRPRPHPAPEQLRFGDVFTDHMAVVSFHKGSWQAPRIVPFGELALDPAAAVLHYGQALFEGCKAVRGHDARVRVFRIDDHVARLARGAKRLCMPPVPAALARELLLAFVQLEADWVPSAPGTALYLRPTLIATEPFLGVRPAREYLFFIIASPVARYFRGAHGGPLAIWVEDRDTRAASGGLGGVKAAGNYAASLRAAERARRRGYSQVLWTRPDDRDAIQEVGNMNVFVDFGDEIATPPLDGTILGGITRDTALTLLRRRGAVVRERRIGVGELLEASRTGRLREVFGTGTGAGVAAVGELGMRGHRIRIGDGGEGPVARQLMTDLDDVQSGASPDPDGWTTEVGTAA